MTKISPKIVAEALYLATNGKSGQDLDLALQRALQFLRNKHMLGQSEEVLRILQNIIDEKSGTVRAKIITAKKLTSEERKKIEHGIKEKYQAQAVVSNFFEKMELLGGMRVEVKDEVLDTTYKNKLRQLEKFLIREK